MRITNTGHFGIDFLDEDFNAKKVLVEAKERFGSVKALNGLPTDEIVLTEDAKLDGNEWVSEGLTDKLDKVLVTFELRDNWEEIAESGDNSEVCNWDNAVSIDKI